MDNKIVGVRVKTERELLKIVPDLIGGSRYGWADCITPEMQESFGGTFLDGDVNRKEKSNGSTRVTFKGNGYGWDERWIDYIYAAPIGVGLEMLYVEIKEIKEIEAPKEFVGLFVMSGPQFIAAKILFDKVGKSTIKIKNVRLDDHMTIIETGVGLCDYTLDVANMTGDDLDLDEDQIDELVADGDVLIELNVINAEWLTVTFEVYQ